MPDLIDPYTIGLIDSYLPADVIEALGEPDHIHHGRLLVFAQNRQMAWDRLRSMGLEPNDSRKIGLAVGDDVHVLVERGLDYNGATYAINKTRGTVVEILPARHLLTLTTGKDRHLVVIGQLCRTHGKLHWHDTRDGDIVSDKMVRAALEIVDGPYIKTDFEDMRLAIYAALQAREK
jgi:hypothetical protein